jgi:hypothetical protein
MKPFEVGTISLPPSFRSILSQAWSDLHQILRKRAPALAQAWHTWASSLAPGREPIDYFLHPYAYPTLLLPWWLDESLGGQADLQLQRTLIRSSLAGYYAIRLIDDAVDGDAPERIALLPLVALLQAEFHAIQIHKQYSATQRDMLQNAWAASHEASWLDSTLTVVDAARFQQYSARKVAAVRVPLLVVAWHHGLTDLSAPWSRCLDQLGAWHQFHNDLFDWQRDLQAQRNTWFTSMIEQHRGSDTALTWVAKEGFAWGVDQLTSWYQELLVLSHALNCTGLSQWLTERNDILQHVANGVLSGFAQLTPLIETNHKIATDPFADLFETGHAMFQRFCQELQRHGLAPSSNLKFEKGHGLLVAYDLEQSTISVSLPDPQDPIGRLQMALFKPMLGCSSDEDMARCIALLLPRLIGHELGHHLRHHYGCFGHDLWHEEQVANIVASALTRTVYDPTSRNELKQCIQRAMTALAKNLDAESLAVVSHHSPVSAWLADGHLHPGLARTATLLAEGLNTSPEQLLAASGRLPPEAVAGLNHRKSFVDRFNETYTRSLQLYTYLQLSWLLVDLECGTEQYVGALAQQVLGQADHLPTAPARSKSCSAFAAQTLAAHRHLQHSHPAVSRYFYKRYRQAVLNALGMDLVSMLESLDEEQTGTLDLIQSMLSSGAQSTVYTDAASLLHIKPAKWTDIAFSEDADYRLWQWAALGATDAGAALLAERLQWLEHSELFRALPADALVRLAQDLHPIQLQAGEVLIWQGSRSEDLFILNSGTLTVERNEAGRYDTLATLQPGAIVGDLAFLTHAPRTATVKANTAVQGAVVRASTVRLLSASYPVITMHLARVLAERFSKK